MKVKINTDHRVHLITYYTCPRVIDTVQALIT